MTLIDKAEALATLRKHANGKTVLGGQVYQSLTLETALEAIAALPARGVGVRQLEWFDITDEDCNFEAYATGFRYWVRILGTARFAVFRNAWDLGDHPDAETAKAAAQADYEARILAALEPTDAPNLADPVTVHANMLRGTIAKPTVEQIIHLYGVDTLAKALAPVIVREAAPYMTDLMVDPETIPDMEMEYDHRAGDDSDD